MEAALRDRTRRKVRRDPRSTDRSPPLRPRGGAGQAFGANRRRRSSLALRFLKSGLGVLRGSSNKNLSPSPTGSPSPPTHPSRSPSRSPLTKGSPGTRTSPLNGGRLALGSLPALASLDELGPTAVCECHVSHGSGPASRGGAGPEHRQVSFRVLPAFVPLPPPQSRRLPVPAALPLATAGAVDCGHASTKQGGGDRVLSLSSALQAVGPRRMSRVTAMMHRTRRGKGHGSLSSGGSPAGAAAPGLGVLLQGPSPGSP